MKNIKQNLLLALMVARLLAVPASATANELLVDTTFREADGKKISVEKKSEPPLERPTALLIVPPSTIALGTEKLGQLAPPYALVTVAASEKNPEVVANASVLWDLRSANLTSGKYIVTYKTVLLTEAAQGGTFIVVLGDGGKRLPQHWTQVPLTVSFRNGKMWVPGKDTSPMPVISGETYEVTIRFDLDTKTWSASANGAALVDGQPFPEAFQSLGNLQVIGLEFGCIAGRFDQPGGVYAIKNVRMTRGD